jgi:hypothetical protein
MNLFASHFLLEIFLFIVNKPSSHVVDCSDLNGKAYDKNGPNREWRITFYTGNKIWAGTDSDIFLELIGDNGNSPILPLNPHKMQLEAQSVDTFSLGNLDGRNIGLLRSIVIVKQYSYDFFNDWQLVKAVVTDPNDKKYVFVCKCWFNSRVGKRLINVSYIEESQNKNELNSIFADDSNHRMFPVSLILLLFFLGFLTFIYFTKAMCRKFRRNLNQLYDMGRGSARRNANGEQHVNDTPPHTTLSIRHMNRSRWNAANLNEQDQQYSANIPLNTLDMNLKEDKPPDYKDLFPVNANSQMCHTTSNGNGNSVPPQSPPPPPQPVPTPASQTTATTASNTSQTDQPANQISV